MVGAEFLCILNLKPEAKFEGVNRLTYLNLNVNGINSGLAFLTKCFRLFFVFLFQSTRGYNHIKSHSLEVIFFPFQCFCVIVFLF